MVAKKRMDSYEVDTPRNDELLTLEEAAALLKVPKSWIYERTRRGAIPHLKLGKYLRFPLADLLRWIHTQRGPAAREAVSATQTHEKHLDPDGS
jgi:excisionase family DNA binding protein